MRETGIGPAAAGDQARAALGIDPEAIDPRAWFDGFIDAGLRAVKEAIDANDATRAAYFAWRVAELLGDFWAGQWQGFARKAIRVSKIATDQAKEAAAKRISTEESLEYLAMARKRYPAYSEAECYKEAAKIVSKFEDEMAARNGLKPKGKRLTGDGLRKRHQRAKAKAEAEAN